MTWEISPMELAEQFETARARTLQLSELVRAETDLRRSPGFGFRPILWHLAHIGVFESYWLLQRLNKAPSLAPRYDVIFDPIKTPREDSRDLPPLAEMQEYLRQVRQAVLRYLEQPGLTDSPEPLLQNGYIFHLILEHEYQHQETLTYLLHLLTPTLLHQPAAYDRRREFLAQVAGEPDKSMVKVPAGPFELGSTGSPFAYDNEQPPHQITLPDFYLAKNLVTNADFAAFIAAGGYTNRAHWSAEGWDWKEANNITAPLYWEARDQAAPAWQIQVLFETGALQPHLPVTGVSWHEAAAYARFVGKRLPTEAEWEKAASWEPEANRKRRFAWGDEPPSRHYTNADDYFFGPTPVGAFPAGQSAYGCLDLTGNVWEWTASTFAGYPGFVPYPYPEYSEVWFDGDHRVLKGGSWATRPPLLRGSFRNFFRPGFRIAFAGFRCATNG